MTRPRDSNFDLASDQWASLRGLLDTAMEMPVGQRAGWMEQLGPEHAALLPRLCALLAHADSPLAAALIHTLPKVETDQFAPGPPGAETDSFKTTQIGPYRLLRQLGEGGMASVWLAERTDLLQQRKVALKLPHGAWRRAGLAERMSREREILATLEHPHIARLYDAGLADDGQPYLALEYVAGVRIDAFCREHKLPIRQRLHLFQQACEAVACAHASLVVHRDLKPSNILVTDAGEVKLLDFGIAKLLDQGLADETALTLQTGRALTPDYAAPEQIRGHAIGTGADIYALGVVLFELLCDTRPYVLKRDTRAALEEAILQADVPRPSGVAPAARQRALRGDLDTIVLKALKKEPAQRYGTVQAFADDVGRHLNNLPVQAQPDRWSYRLHKYVVRHRLGVAMTSVLLLTIIGGAGAALWQADAARTEQRRAEEVLGFITSIFRDADPSVGPQDKPGASELLARARSRVDGQFAGQPVTRIELMCVLAESFLGLQEIDAASEAAQSALTEATRLLTPEHPLALRARSVLAQVHRNRGEPAAMRSQIEHILAALQGNPNRDPRRLVEALINRAELELDEDKIDASQASAKEALRVADASPGIWDSERSLAWKAIATALDDRINYEAATEASELAYRYARSAHPDQPRHPQIINSRLIYARTLALGDRIEEALALIQQSVDDWTTLFGPSSRMVGQALQNLAVSQARAGELDAARTNAERALIVLEQHYGEVTGHIGAAVDALAFIQFSARRPELAVPLYDRALRIVNQLLGPNSEHSYPQRMRRATSLAYLGRTAEALPELRRVADEYTRIGRAAMSGPWHHLGIALRLAGQPAEALEQQERALAAVREGPMARRERLTMRVEMGLNLVELGRHQEAMSLLEAVLPEWDRTMLKPTPMRSDAALALGRAQLVSGQNVKALVHLEQSDAYWSAAAPDSRWAGQAAYWIARGRTAAGSSDQAKAAFARAAELLSRSPNPVDAEWADAARRSMSTRQ